MGHQRDIAADAVVLNAGALGAPADCHHPVMASQTASRTPCWHCKHMISVEPRSTIVQCGRSKDGGPTSFTRGGGKGCDAWEREPGIDDDDWDPAGVPRLGPYVPEQPPQPRARSRGTDGWWTELPRRRAAPPPRVIPILLSTRDPFGGMFNWDDDG